MARTSSVDDDSHQLRKWRTKQGLSSVTVAKDLGISQPFLHDIETRDKRPSLDKVAEIAILTKGAVDFIHFLPAELAKRYAKRGRTRSRH